MVKVTKSKWNKMSTQQRRDSLKDYYGDKTEASNWFFSEGIGGTITSWSRKKWNNLPIQIREDIG